MVERQIRGRSSGARSAGGVTDPISSQKSKQSCGIPKNVEEPSGMAAGVLEHPRELAENPTRIRRLEERLLAMEETSMGIPGIPQFPLRRQDFGIKD